VSDVSASRGGPVAVPMGCWGAARDRPDPQLPSSLLRPARATPARLDVRVAGARSPLRCVRGTPRQL